MSPILPPNQNLRKTVRVPLLRNQVLKVEFGKTLGVLGDFEKRIEFAQGTRVLDAFLEVTASQTYLSGADISLSMNDRLLLPAMMWHALENGTKSMTYNVTTEVVNGVNKFSGIYRTAFGTISDQLANISETLILDLIVSSGEPEVKVGGTKQPGATTNVIAQKLKDASNIIIGGAIVAIVAISGIYLITKNPRDIRKSLGL